MQTQSMEVKVKRIFKLENGTGLKAFADIVVNDALLIKGLKIFSGESGELNVRMPGEKAKDGKWYDNVRCLSKDLKEYIAHEVLAAYESNG